MDAMQVYQLTIQENGHSRRFVYEDRDEALTPFADAIAAGLDAKLDEVARAGAPKADRGCRTRSRPFATRASCSGRSRSRRSRASPSPRPSGSLSLTLVRRRAPCGETWRSSPIFACSGRKRGFHHAAAAWYS